MLFEMEQLTFNYHLMGNKWSIYLIYLLQLEQFRGPKYLIHQHSLSSPAQQQFRSILLQRFICEIGAAAAELRFCYYETLRDANPRTTLCVHQSNHQQQIVVAYT